VTPARLIGTAIDALLCRCEDSALWFTATVAVIAFLIFGIGYGIVVWVWS
jgi:hypothetical protein